VQDDKRFEAAMKVGGWPSLGMARASTAGGAPSFAHFAKGGYRKADSKWSYATLALNQILPHPSLTFTTPDSSSR
jgi:hypothetical protein